MKPFMTTTFLVLCAAFAWPCFASAEDDDALLGVYLENLTDDLRGKYSFEGEGVYVNDVVEDSGAGKAGIKVGDIIVRFNGEDVASYKQLVNGIEKTSPGEEVEVVVFSGGSEKKLTVIMGKNQGWKKSVPLPPSTKKWMTVYEPRPYLGINMQNISPQLAEYFTVDAGVLITEVKEGSPAGEAGLKAGDVITAWKGGDIEEMSDIYVALEDEEPGKKVLLAIVRKGEEMEVKVTLGKREEIGFGSGLPGIKGDLTFKFDDLWKIQNYYWPNTYKAPKIVVPDLKKRLDSYEQELEKLRTQVEELRKILNDLKE